MAKYWQKIEEIHQQWNGYVGEGRKKGVSADNLEKFSNSLNLLTKAIENKNVADIYDYGSQSMSNLSPAFELYKDEVLGEINKIKNATYQSYLKFLEDKTTQASRILADGKEEISKLRLKLKDDEKKIKSLDKVGISLEEMEKSIKEDSLKLIRIKMDIVLKSLGDLEK